MHVCYTASASPPCSTADSGSLRHSGAVQAFGRTRPLQTVVLFESFSHRHTDEPPAPAEIPPGAARQPALGGGATRRSVTQLDLEPHADVEAMMRWARKLAWPFGLISAHPPPVRQRRASRTRVPSLTPAHARVLAWCQPECWDGACRSVVVCVLYFVPPTVQPSRSLCRSRCCSSVSRRAPA